MEVFRYLHGACLQRHSAYCVCLVKFLRSFLSVLLFSLRLRRSVRRYRRRYRRRRGASASAELLVTNGGGRQRLTSCPHPPSFYIGPPSFPFNPLPLSSFLAFFIALRVGGAVSERTYLRRGSEKPDRCHRPHRNGRSAVVAVTCDAKGHRCGIMTAYLSLVLCHCFIHG